MHGTLDLATALKIVRDAGYRVNRPKASPKRQTQRGPTFVAQFADGLTARMTTFCKNGVLDYDRGMRLAGYAWQSRMHTEDSPPPIVNWHFERDGVRLEPGITLAA